MLETIAYGLISTVINHIFDTSVLKMSTTDIEGAPNWYQKQGKKRSFYVSSFCDGDIDAVDCAKDAVKKEVVIIVEEAFDKTFETSLKHYKGKDCDIIEKMQYDKDLPRFVCRNIIFQDIKYDAKLERAFVRGYVTYGSLEEYERERIRIVKKEVLDHHYEEMMEELDKVSQ